MSFHGRDDDPRFGGLAGKLKVTIDHADLAGADYPFERSGVPAIWGDSLVHEDIGAAASPEATVKALSDKELAMVAAGNDPEGGKVSDAVARAAQAELASRAQGKSGAKYISLAIAAVLGIGWLATRKSSRSNPSAHRRRRKKPRKMTADAFVREQARARAAWRARR